MHFRFRFIPASIIGLDCTLLVHGKCLLNSFALFLLSITIASSVLSGYRLCFDISPFKLCRSIHGLRSSFPRPIVLHVLSHLSTLQYVVNSVICVLVCYLDVVLLFLLMISVTHSTCGQIDGMYVKNKNHEYVRVWRSDACLLLALFLGGVCAAASTILVASIAKFRSYYKNWDKKQHARLVIILFNCW